MVSISSVQFNHSVVSDSLQSHESQHARPPCPSPSPGLHLLTSTQSTSWEMLGWKKHKLESRLLEEISITSRYADDTTLMAESEEELKRLLMKVKEESKKFGLKLNIQKTKIMTSGPITSWEIDGETVETVSDFIFWAPESLQMVTAAMELKDAYSLEGKLWAT